MELFEEIRKKIDTYCGLSCADCEFRQSMDCGGCVATQGHPFHGECPLAQCAIGRNRGFCGECKDFPCGLLESYSNDPEHGDDPKGARIRRCGEIKARLVAAAREGRDPQGVCGHHCCHCPFSQWCGGCRSVYNSCSFGTLFPGGSCPNVDCCRERGLDGCYDCPELEDCGTGYFSCGDGYKAKGAALFIREHGKAAYERALNTGSAKEVNSLEDMLEFLESSLK